MRQIGLLICWIAMAIWFILKRIFWDFVFEPALRYVPATVWVAGLYFLGTYFPDFTDAPLVSVRLPSGAIFDPTFSSCLAFLVIGALAVEVARSTGTKTREVNGNFILSVAALVSAVVLFIASPLFGTIDFAMIMLATLADVIVSVLVMMRGARRDVNVAPDVTSPAYAHHQH